MKRLLETLRGTAAVVGMILVTLLFFFPLLPVSLVKLLAPWPALRRPAGRAVEAIARAWAHAINACILGFGGTRVCFDQQIPDDHRGRYLIISNHQCWADVMLLVHVVLPCLPFPRYFIKEKLRWLPVVGLACWALDFPFMKRHTRAELEANPKLRNDDMQTIRRSCENFRELPVSIVNYAEGTRSTPAKRAAADSPYATALVPKAGGTAFALNAMRDVLDQVLDMTVAYVDTPEPTFWGVLSGRIKHVAIRLRSVDVPDELFEGDYMGDPQYRNQFKQWLEAIWAEKDREVAAIQDPDNPTTGFSDAPNPFRAQPR